MKIVIVEDELNTAKDLEKTIISIEKSYEIVAILQSVEEALEFFHEKQEVDLIFSDIQLGDGLSFEIYQNTDFKLPPIIFCTAFDQYALDAFRNNGIDYVLKPFSKDSIKTAITKFIDLKGKLDNSLPDFAGIIAQLKEKQPSVRGAVIVYQGDKIIPIDTQAIALFYTENTINYAYTFDAKSYALNDTLDTLEKRFYPLFFRANRQFLINRKAVKDASHFFNRKMVVNIAIPFKEKIIVSKLKTTLFLNWLAG
jgi:two-component system, LytTR family, response regulator LytT